MRYHIDTIPVWDALRQKRFCPFCYLKRQLEVKDVDRFLGGSVMEPDIRIKVNEKGFCQKHQAMLWEQKNRLGHALMMESHLEKRRSGASEAFSAAREAAQAASDGGIRKKIRGYRDEREAIRAAASRLSQQAQSCILCDSLRENMQRYLYTFLYLYESDPSFVKTLREGCGICLPHCGDVLNMAADELKGKTLSAFCSDLETITNNTLDSAQTDIHDFTLKFDYRNAGKEIGNSRGALERCVNLLSGCCIGDDPAKE